MSETAVLISASTAAALAPVLEFEVFAAFATLAGLAALLLFAAGEHAVTSEAATTIAKQNNLDINFPLKKKGCLGLSKTLRYRIRLAVAYSSVGNLLEDE
jgi:hypothetical protein